MDYTGKTVIITGGSTGIGEAISMSFAGAGASVAILSSHIEKYEDKLTEQLNKLGVKYKLYSCDVTNSAQVKETVDDIKQEFGTIDILVNNAGITKDGLVVRMNEEDFDSVINVNLKGTYNFIRAVAPIMFKARAGRIINISSIIGISGNFGQANYAASKAGIIGLTKSVSKELGGRNITVNAVAPGFIQTAMTSELSDDIIGKLTERLSIKRLGEPNDVAQTVLFLASDAASYITGQVIQVDGGITV